MDQKLAITGVTGITTPEPAIFEIKVTLEDKSRATLRLSIFTLRDLFAAIKPVAGVS